MFSKLAPLVASVCAVSILAGCVKPEIKYAQPRLVILYATCTVNKNYLSPYNPSIPFTPNLEAFKKRSLAFPRHHTEAGQSGVSFASLFSGSQAMHHGIFAHPNEISDDVTLIAESFREAGYDTFAWLAHQMASTRLNYAQGVEPGKGAPRALTADARKFREILERLESEPSYRAFIVTNFTVTHGPYDTRHVEEFCGLYPGHCEARKNRRFDILYRLYRKHMRSLGRDFDATVKRLRIEDEIDALADTIELVYKSTVFSLDRRVGTLVDAIDESGLTDDTVIAFTADHGEVLYRENALQQWTHGFQLAPEVLNVPFILFGPGTGVPAGTYAGTSRSIDVFPTLAGLAGIDAPSFPEFGVDLSDAVRGRSEAPDLRAFSHTALYEDKIWAHFRRYNALMKMFPNQEPDGMWVGVRSGDLFAKRRRTDGTNWESVVFDLAKDPGETTDVFDANDPLHRSLFEELESYKAKLVARAGHVYGAVPTEESLELLRSMGYVN